MFALLLLTSLARAADWPPPFDVPGSDLKLHPIRAGSPCSGAHVGGRFYLYAAWTPPGGYDLAKTATYACSAAKFQCDPQDSANLALSRGVEGTGSWSFRAYATLAWVRASPSAVETFYAVKAANLDLNDETKMCVEAADIVNHGAVVAVAVPRSP